MIIIVSYNTILSHSILTQTILCALRESFILKMIVTFMCLSLYYFPSIKVRSAMDTNRCAVEANLVLDHHPLLINR